MSRTGTAERRNLYQPDRVRTESRDSDSPTVVQTHFRIGKDYLQISWHRSPTWCGAGTKVFGMQIAWTIRIIDDRLTPGV